MLGLFGGVSVAEEGAAGADPVRSFTRNSYSSKPAPPLAKAEPINVSANKSM